VTPAPGGGALKIILIVLGIVAFLMMAAMGSCFYVAYRFKQRAAEFTHAAGSESTYRGVKDACSLISASEVSDAIGQPVEQADDSNSYNCRFRYGGANNSNALDVQFTWQGGAIAMKLARATLEHVGKDTFTPVAGVGDEAYIGPMGSSLMMRKGDVLVNIDLQQAGLNLPAAKKIASRIASRL
jgi:hypothetical protein